MLPYPGAPRRSRSLPQYTAGGSNEPIFRALQRKETDIAREVAALSIEQLRGYSLLSANAKTSVSLDFPIGHTCDPTALCARVCYGAGPRAAATWRKSLRKRLRNLRYFEIAPTEELVDRMSHEFDLARRRWSRRARIDYLRVNGTGDLFPASVAFVNAFATQRPDVRLWIVTRRFELAPLIDARPNIYLQLSLDASTPPALVTRAHEVVHTHPRAYLSFLRTTAFGDTGGAAIVFNEKRTEGLPDRGSSVCPADAGRLELDNIRGVGGTACARCRKCFSDSTLARQRALPL